MDDDVKTTLEQIHDLAEVANAVASLVVGHRKILVEGGFDINLADAMAANLHASLLGLVHVFDNEEDEILEFLIGDSDDEED